MKLKRNEEYYYIELKPEFGFGTTTGKFIYSRATYKKETIDVALKQYNLRVKKKLDNSTFILICNKKEAKELEGLVGDYFNVVPSGTYINEEYLNSL